MMAPLFDARITHAEAEAARAEEALSETIRLVQAECAHESLGEASAAALETASFFAAPQPLPAIRVCLCCGLSERAGPDGFRALVAVPVALLSRADALDASRDP